MMAPSCSDSTTVPAASTARIAPFSAPVLGSNLTADLNVAGLRIALARSGISYRDFAAAAGLSRSYLAHVLRGYHTPGELCRLKLRRGMAAFGLEAEEEVRDGQH